MTVPVRFGPDIDATNAMASIAILLVSYVARSLKTQWIAWNARFLSHSCFMMVGYSTTVISYSWLALKFGSRCHYGPARAAVDLGHSRHMSWHGWL